MPISERFDHERRWVETTIEGPVTFADFESHWHRELAARGEGYPELIDGRSAEVAFDAHDVRRMVEVLRLVAASRPLGPTAILVQSDVGFGMVRMLSLLVEPFCAVQPFRDRASAERWLEGLGEPTTPAP